MYMPVKRPAPQSSQQEEDRHKGEQLNQQKQLCQRMQERQRQESKYHPHHPQNVQQPKTIIKLKVLVLGAAAAGKTSIIRRYYNKTFNPDSPRVPTIGSDFYSTKVENIPYTEENGDTEGVKKGTYANPNSTTATVSISLQMWDTPGRERLDFQQRLNHHRGSKKGTVLVQESFLKHANAIMLVYDMTSSTSFKQLLKWYAQIMESKKEGHPNNNHKNHVPILVVANKLDLLRDQEKGLYHRQQLSSPQQNDSKSSNSKDAANMTMPRTTGSPRDVLGLNGNFYGKDFRYEYQVSRIDDREHESAPNSGKQRNHHHRKRKLDGYAANSYLADRENWTNDGSYLESLVTSEDGSYPDRDIVVLWCKRNGLEHMEVSAATGEGVDEAVCRMIRLALDYMKQIESDREHGIVIAKPTPAVRASSTSSSYSTVSRNQALDVGRYARKEENCCFPFLRPLLAGLRKSTSSSSI